MRGIAECDERGYIVTDRLMKTSCEGAVCCGPMCVSKPLRQVVTAVGDGALAATELERYARPPMQKKTGLHPEQPSKKIEKAVKTTGESGIFTPEMTAQLRTVFDKMSVSR